MEDLSGSDPEDDPQDRVSHKPGLADILDDLDDDELDMKALLHSRPEPIYHSQEYDYVKNPPSFKKKEPYNLEATKHPSIFNPNDLLSKLPSPIVPIIGSGPGPRARSLAASRADPGQPSTSNPGHHHQYQSVKPRSARNDQEPLSSSAPTSPTKSGSTPRHHPRKNCKESAKDIRNRVNTLKFNALGGDKHLNLEAANPSLMYSVDDTLLDYFHTNHGMPKDIYNATMALWREDRWEHLTDPPHWLTAEMYGFCFLPNTTSSNGLIALGIAKQNLMFAQANAPELTWRAKMTKWKNITDTMTQYSPPIVGPVTLYDAIMRVADKLTSILEVFPVILQDSGTILEDYSRKIVAEGASFSSSTNAKIDQIVKLIQSVTGYDDQQSGKIMIHPHTQVQPTPLHSQNDHTSSSALAAPNLSAPVQKVFIGGKWRDPPTH